jgi:hypothetical protein
MPALAPKSAVRDQTVDPDGATEEPPPWIARASRRNPTRPSPEPFPLISGSRLGLVPLGLGMILMLSIVIAGSVVLGWVQMASDDLHYGRPRTFQIIAQEGEEVLALKDNQKDLCTEVQATFALAPTDADLSVEELCTVERAHGRVEERTYRMISDPAILAYLDAEHRWAGLSAIGMVTAQRQIGAEMSQETR